MMPMRSGFREIVDGWPALDDPGDVGDRLSLAVDWLLLNSPAEHAERIVVALMIERQIELAGGDDIADRAGIIDRLLETPEPNRPDPE